MLNSNTYLPIYNLLSAEATRCWKSWQHNAINLQIHVLDRDQLNHWHDSHLPVCKTFGLFKSWTLSNSRLSSCWGAVREPTAQWWQIMLPPCSCFCECILLVTFLGADWCEVVSGSVCSGWTVSWQSSVPCLGSGQCSTPAGRSASGGTSQLTTICR